MFFEYQESERYDYLPRYEKLGIRIAYIIISECQVLPKQLTVKRMKHVLEQL